MKAQLTPSLLPSLMLGHSLIPPPQHSVVCLHF